jgi:hypothetical protein
MTEPAREATQDEPLTADDLTEDDMKGADVHPPAPGDDDQSAEGAGQ